MLYLIILSCFIIQYSDGSRNAFLSVLGEQHQPVLCFEMDVGVVDESLCDPASHPQVRHRKCKNMDCPARSVHYFIQYSCFVSLALLLGCQNRGFSYTNIS